MLKTTFNSLVWKENKLFVAKCLEVEVASQGATKKEALKNLKEALELYFEDEKVEKLSPNFFFKQPQVEKIAFNCA